MSSVSRRLLGFVTYASDLLTASQSLLFKSRTDKLITDLGKAGKKVNDDDTNGQGEDEYDIIIVGGGTSGCALASRITEDPNIKVLVIETGGSGKKVEETRHASTFVLMFRNPKHVHQFYTEPQANLNGRKIFWPRAKLLGGCSNINAVMAQFGAPGDFDEWATLTNDPSWNFENFKKYFTKMETFQPHPDYPDVDASKRGSKGPIQIGYNPYVTHLAKYFVEACNNIGIPSTTDFVWQVMGASRVLSYIDSKFRRSSAETAYLNEAVLSRPNLKVVIKATVTKILFDKVAGSSQPRAVGVEIMKGPAGPKYIARAKKEVILSAGAIHSPQILMLSGVGPAKELAKHNIPVVADIPAVGELVDHPSIDLNYRNTDGASMTYMASPKGLIQRLLYAKELFTYLALGKCGPAAVMATEGVAFFRTDDSRLFDPKDYPKLHDSTSPNGPDMEIFSSPAAWKDHASWFLPGDCLGLHACLLRPESKGRLSLKTASPWDAPLMDPNYFSVPDDLQKMIRGVRVLTRLSRTEPLASSIDNSSPETCFQHDLYSKSDAELGKFIVDNAEALYHPACTCKMGTSVANGVVDSQMRVFGLSGLRVCDASIFPKIVSGHPTGACYAIAEKLADQIKEAYGSR